MTTQTLTPAQRQSLKGLAHSLDPVILIGDAGLTPAVLKESERAIAAHQLIKIRVSGDDRDARLAIYQTLCLELKAAPVQHIGKMLVLYRPAPESATPLQPVRAATRGRSSVATKAPRNRTSRRAEAPTSPPRPNRTARVRASGQRSAKKAFQAR